jgi:molybdopterin molybdotransferase
MIPLAEAEAYVLSHCPPLAPRPVPLDEALGCVCAATVAASEPVPPFVNSSMDGYAVRSIDTAAASEVAPVGLRLVGTVLAGSTGSVPVGSGQAARIMTGAPLPDGSDAVVMQETCQLEDDGTVVVLEQPVRSGSCIRTIGQDVATGTTVVAAGTELTPGHLGSLANQGLSEVTVHPRIRVGVLSTGDELATADMALTRGQIRDANRPTLLALVERQGWVPVDLGTVGDDAAEVAEALDGAAGRCDAVLTSGGVSVGDADVVKTVLRERCDGSMRWMQVAIRPAKPFAFGILEGSGLPVFGLPGNPVSAMVSFELLVRPAGRRMGGHRHLHHLTVPATVVGDIRRRPDGKTHYIRSVLTIEDDGAWRVRPLDGQQSHQLSVMAEANALAVVADGDGVAAGGTVSVLVVAPDRLHGSTGPA